VAIAQPAQGTTLAYSTNSGSTYTSVGEVINIGGAGGGEVGERDTTILVSTTHTNAPTIPDNGEVTFDLNWDPTDAAHQQIRAWKDSPPPVASIPLWKVTYNTSASNTSVFLGWVKSLDGVGAEGIDDNLVMSVTLRVTGPVTNT
jgi:hypothetical protein